MVSTKITRQRLELNGQHEITHQRMENQIVSTKITRPRVGQYKNNSPKGWVAQNQLAKGMELNGQHENNSLKGWTVQK